MTRPTFLGLSVQDFKTSIGWGANQTSTLTVQLVQDLLNGDEPAPGPLGGPIYFQFGSLNFFGLLQRWSKKKSPAGFPVYEATCVDPREILEGTSLIIGQYMGSVAPVANLLSPFGWWENTGYGNSLANDAGMPWDQMSAAIKSICNASVSGPYGGPLSFRGTKYGLDLSQMPIPDAGYRVGGGNASTVGLLEVISTICEDGACDFFVDLVGFTITIRTVSRRVQPPLGTINNFINENTGSILRNEDGLEVRNEVTSSFLTGGDVCDLYQTDDSAMSSFWGYDIAGNPILGVPGQWVFQAPGAGRIKPVISVVPTEFMSLNATGIADIIGSTSYKCSTLEMRLAMVNYESWAAFIYNWRPDVKPFIFTPFANGLPAILQRPVKPDGVNSAKANAILSARTSLGTTFLNKAMRLYEFVRKYGNDFFGKKFLVGLPFIFTKQDPETLQFGYSQEPTDAGWQPDGATPLGLTLLNQNVMQTQDSRFRAFVGYANAVGCDTSRVSDQDTVSQTDGSMYIRANVSKEMVFLPNGQPAALVTLGSAVYAPSVDAFGDLSIVAATTFGATPEQAQPMFKNKAFGNVGGIKCWPDAFYPDAFAIPLKSTVLAYGPWYVAGPPGKVKAEIDSSMTPWTYGGWDEMNAAANAKVLNAVTNMQVSEAGLLEVAGMPSCSLGGVLQTGGPNVSNIEVSFGKDGITTSYRFATFTPRFGVFSKQTADRIKRLGQTAMNVRKSLLASVKQEGGIEDTFEAAARGFMANAPKAIKMESPHEVLVCHSEWDPDGVGWRVCPQSLTYEEAVGSSNSDDDKAYSRTAIMSLDGLLRPYTTSSSGVGMAAVTTPTNMTGHNSFILNPWLAGNDIAYLAFGNSYTDANSYRNGNDATSTRAMALRGPVVISGWGYDLQGNPVPGNGSGGWFPNLLRRCDVWKVGPLDVAWDNERGVWTPPGNRMGTIAATGAIGPGGSGLMTLVSGSSLAVWNPWSVPVSGVTVAAAYMADTNRWNIIAADCSM